MVQYIWQKNWFSLKYKIDIVKFQKRDPEILAWKQKHLLRKPRSLITYLDYKKKIEFGKKEFDVINNYCKKNKMVCFYGT